MRGFINLCESSFAGRVRAYYLSGSYSDGSGVDIGNPDQSSDLDIFPMIKGEFQEGEAENFSQLIAACNQLCPLVLDVHPAAEGRLYQTEQFSAVGSVIRTSGSLLYGKDIQANIPEMPFENYLLHVLWQAIFHIGISRQAKPQWLPLPVPLSYPLSFPEPQAEFYGYEMRRKRANGQVDRPGIRLMVAVALWVATTNLALKAGRQVGTKIQSYQLYKELVNDGWTRLIEEIFIKC